MKLGLLKLSLTGTAQVNSMGTEPVKSSVPLTREKILADYKDVFEGLGHIGESSTFVVNPNQPPVQHAPRRIPVTLQIEVKEKIAELRRKASFKRLPNPLSGLVVWPSCQSQER